MLRFCLVLTVAVTCLALVPSRALAQTSTNTNLADLLRSSFLENIVLAKTPSGNGVVAHTPVFLDDPRVTDVTTLVGQVNQEIGTQISTFPLGSSAGGFTYSFEPNTGVFNRNTTTFGPAFADRAVTIGRHRWNFGANYQHSSYNNLEGRNLSDGTIKFFLLHQPLNPPSYVEGDVIQAALALDLRSDIFAMFANYGLTDALDLGVAVPIVRVNMNVTYHATILDYATHIVSPNTHLFANGTKNEDFSSAGSASGIGDVVVRAKYNFLKRPGGGLAAAMDLRLPTGDDTNLLGTGTTQARLFLIVSGAMGRFAPHLNVGYTISGTGTSFPVGDQFNYTGGVEFAAHPRVTIVGDLVGRTENSVYRLNDSPQIHTFQQGSSAPIESVTLPEVATTTGNLTTALAAVGMKANPWHTLLISAHLLIPLNSAGLRAGVTPVIGFDWAF